MTASVPRSPASIYTARITGVRQQLPPAPPGVINLNCLNFFPNNIAHHPLVGEIRLDQISPYVLKDAQGHFHECIWQFSKIYATIEAQHEIKAGKLIWSHPAEVHVVDGQLTPAYWAWRKKGWNNPYPVRYPNGYHGRHKCLCSLWHDGEKWITLDYIRARKIIYCRTYATLVRQTEAFQKLKTLYNAGVSIQICEIDVRPGLVTEEFLTQEINSPKFPFGHGMALAACLLDLDQIWE